MCITHVTLFIYCVPFLGVKSASDLKTNLHVAKLLSVYILSTCMEGIFLMS